MSVKNNYNYDIFIDIQWSSCLRATQGGWFISIYGNTILIDSCKFERNQPFQKTDIYFFET